LGSWKVVASIQATHQYPSVSTKGGWRRHTVKSTRNSFEDSLTDVLVLEIDCDDLGTDGFGHSESGGDCVNGVYLGSSLEEGPLDGAELELGLVIYRSKKLKLTPIGPRLRCQYILIIITERLTPKYRLHHPSRHQYRQLRGRR
jgi:hypothetical protein